MTVLTGFGLNVWCHDGDDLPEWRMAIYPDTPDGTDTDQYISFTPTLGQLERYFEISEDSDWWVYDRHPHFGYILWGDRP